jgi:hypothetical protein
MPGCAASSLAALVHYRDLVYTLTAHRIRVRYKQSLLGVSWAILQPLSLMLIYTVVFSLFARMPSEGKPYAVFAYTALLPWTLFSTALTNATNGLVSNAQLVTKVYFPREILPLSYVVAAGFDFAIGTAVLGLPVPPGFTITTEACREYRDLGNGGAWPDGLEGEVTSHLHRLEQAMGRLLGDPEDPLLVSVRSGAKFSMPGMMDTVLNLGLNDTCVDGLARVTGDERFAYDSYRRFIAMYAQIVLGVEGELFSFDESEHLTDWDPTGDLRKLCDHHKAIVEEQTSQPFPQDRWEQLRSAIDAVFASWDSPRARAYRDHEGIPHDLGTAVTVQAMVFGNRDDESGTGVAFTRDAATGEDRPYGDFLVNAQGEDVVAGIRTPQHLTIAGRTTHGSDLPSMEEVIPEGRGRMTGAEFARGRRPQTGERFG